MSRSDISYVLPLLRKDGDPGLAELTGYLRFLSCRAQVIVADGSAPHLYAQHGELWKGLVVHIPPAADLCANGKVAGVLAGIRSATNGHVVVADDDVRYTDADLAEMSAALESADLVRPQNYFDPLPWHAAWDSARSLLNRCWGSDSPGTLGLRRSFFLQIGGYDGNVLYENLELIRTVTAAGGRVEDRSGMYVRRLPPTTRRFWEQRPRQAYDDFAQPLKLGLFLGVLPALGIGIRRRAVRGLGMAALATVAMAEIGRRRHGGTEVFPPVTSWFAPLWALERGVCSWLAVGYRLGGGIPYSGSRFVVAAHPVALLRTRHPGNVAAIAQWSDARAPAAAQSDH